MLIPRILLMLALGLAVAGCEAAAMNNNPVEIDTRDGQALPHAVWTDGATQGNISHSVTVASGKETKIHFIAFVNPDCSNMGYATMREGISPNNGTLEFKQVEDFTFFPEKNPRAACNTKRVKGIAIRYTSQPGFTGMDKFTFEAIGLAGRMRRYSVTVNVV